MDREAARRKARQEYLEVIAQAMNVFLGKERQAWAQYETALATANKRGKEVGDG